LEKKSLELKVCTDEFRQIIDQIYGTYLDSIRGFNLIIEEIKREKAEITTRRQKYETFYKDTMIFCTYRSYGRLVKPGQHIRHIHQVPYEEIESRNLPQGRNHILIANLCLVTIYQYWNDYYRPSIANCLNININNIQVPLFGDIKFLRESIIHHRGIAISKVERCAILKWFKVGEPIQITKDMFEQMIDEVINCLDKIETDPKQFISSN
jgi:hypothetical protein